MFAITEEKNLSKKIKFLTQEERHRYDNTCRAWKEDDRDHYFVEDSDNYKMIIEHENGVLIDRYYGLSIENNQYYKYVANILKSDTKDKIIRLSNVDMKERTTTGDFNDDLAIKGRWFHTIYVEKDSDEIEKTDEKQQEISNYDESSVEEEQPRKLKAREIYKLMDSNLRIQLMSEFEVNQLDAHTKRHLFWKEKESDHCFLYDLENDKLVNEYEDGVEIESYLKDSTDLNEIVTLKSRTSQKKVEFSLDNMRVRFKDGDFIEEYTRKGWWVFGVYFKSKPKVTVKEVKEIEHRKGHVDNNLFEFKNESDLKEYFQNLDLMHLSIAYIYNQEEQCCSCCSRTDCDYNQSLTIDLNQESNNNQASNSKTNEPSVFTKTSNLVQDINKQLSVAQEKNNRLAFESYKNEIIQLNSQMTEEMKNVKTVEQLNVQLTEALSSKNELIIDSQSAQTEIIKLNSEIAVNLEYFKRVEQRKKSLKEALEEKEQLNKEIKLLDEVILSLRNKHSAELKVIKSETNIKSKKIKKVITNKSYYYSNDMLKLNNKLAKDLEYLKQVEDINEKLQMALNHKEQLLNQINMIKIETNREENQQTEQEALKNQAEIKIEIQKCKDKITNLNDQIQRGQIELKKLKETKTSSVKSKEVNEETKLDLADFIAEKTKLLNEVQNCKKEIIDLNAKIQEDISELQKDEATNKQLTLTLTEKEQIINDIQKKKQQVLELRNKHSIEFERLRAIEEKNEELCSIVSDRENLIKEIQSYKAEILQLTEQLRVDKTQLKKANQIESLSQQIDDENLIQLIHDFRSEICKLDEKVSNEMVQFESDVDSSEDFTIVITEKTKLKNKIQSFKKEINELTSQTSMVLESLKSVQNINENLTQVLANRHLLTLEIKNYKNEILKMNSEISNRATAKINADVNLEVEPTKSKNSVTIKENTEICEFKNKISKLNIDLAVLVENLQPFNEIKEQIEQVINEKEQISTEIDNYKEQIIESNQQLSVYIQAETIKLKESRNKLDTALKANKQLELSIKYIKQEIKRLSSEYLTEICQVVKFDRTKEELSENLKANIEMSEQVHNQVNETSQINIELKTSEQYFTELEELNEKLKKTVCEKGNLLNELQINSNYFNSDQTLRNNTHTLQETVIETSIISNKKEKTATEIKIFKEEVKRLKTLTLDTNYQEQANELKAKLYSLTVDVKKIESEIQTYKKEITTLKSQLQEHTVRIKEFEKLEAEVQLLLADNQKMRLKIQSLKDEKIRLINEITTEIEHIRTLKEVTNQTYVVEETITADKGDVNIRLDYNLKEINVIKSKLDDILEENARLRAEFEQSLQKIKFNKVNQTVESEKKTAELKDELETLKQDLLKLYRKLQITETNKKHLVKTDFDQQNVITEINKYRDEISNLAKLFTENRDRFKVVKENNKKITAEISAKEELIAEIYKELIELNELIQADSKHLQIDTEVTNKIQSALNDKETLSQDVQTYRNEIFKLQNQHSSNVAILKVIQEGNEKLSASFIDKTLLINKIKSYQQEIVKINTSAQESVLSSSESTESIKEEAINYSTDKESITETFNNEISEINKKLSHDIKQFNNVEKLNEQLFISIAQNVKLSNESHIYQNEITRLKKQLEQSLSSESLYDESSNSQTIHQKLKQLDANYKEEIQRLESEINSKSNNIKEFEQIETELKNHLNEKEDLAKKHSIVKAEFIHVNEQLQAYKESSSKKDTTTTIQLKQYIQRKQELNKEFEQYLIELKEINKKSSQLFDREFLIETEKMNVKLSAAQRVKESLSSKSEANTIQIMNLKEKLSLMQQKIQKAEEKKRILCSIIHNRDLLINKFQHQKKLLSKLYFDKFSKQNCWASFLKINLASFKDADQLGFNNSKLPLLMFYLNKDHIHTIQSDKQIEFEQVFQLIQNNLLQIKEANQMQQIVTYNASTNRDNQSSVATEETSKQTVVKMGKSKAASANKSNNQIDQKKKKSAKSIANQSHSLKSNNKQQIESKLTKLKTDSLSFKTTNNLTAFKLATQLEPKAETHQYCALIAESYTQIGHLYEEFNTFKISEFYFRKALTINKSIYLRGSIVIHNSVADSLTDLGLLYLKFKFYKESLQLLLEASAMNQEFYLTATNLYHIKCADSYTNLGLCYQELLDAKNSIDFFKQALEMNKSLHLTETVKIHFRVAGSLLHLGICYFKFKYYIESEIYLKLACEMNESLYLLNKVKSHEMVTLNYTNLGLCYEKLNDFIRCEFYLKKALEMNEDLYLKISEKNFIIADSLTHLGLAQLHFKRFITSELNLKRALKINEKFYLTSKVRYHSKVADSNTNLGLCYQEMEMFKASENYFHLALSMNEALYSSGDASIALCFLHLGSLYYKFEFYSKSEQFFKRAFDIYEPLFKVDSKYLEEIVSIHTKLGLIYLKLDDYSQSESCFKKAYYLNESFYLKDLIRNHPAIAESLTQLGLFYFQIGDLQQSEQRSRFLLLFVSFSAILFVVLCSFLFFSSP